MPTVDFLPFGDAVGADVMTQADYIALAARLSGFQAGIAEPLELNKVWRQSSIIAAAVANYISTITGQDVLDADTTAVATIAAQLAAAADAKNNYALDSGAANAAVVALTPAITTYANGLAIRVKMAATNTLAAVNLNAGGGNKRVKKNDGTDPAASDLLIATIHTVVYILASDQWWCVEPLPSQFVSPAATETVAGVAELATQAESDAGVNDTTITTPLKATTTLTGVARSFTKPQRGTPLAVAFAASLTLDFDARQDFDIGALTAGITINNPTGGAAGQSGMIKLVQDGTGNRNWSFGTYFDFGSGGQSDPNLAANGVTYLAYYVDSLGVAGIRVVVLP